MSKARCIMIQGTMSGAGKSLLAAALCRIFRQDGFRVAPFKSQNMALNSAVTKDGLEMGRAQVMQAEAAMTDPDVRMNPILLKPSSDTGSQVIVNGEIRGHMSAVDYFRYKKELIPDILKAYHSLAEEYDIIVLEGAGSPAEINLKADDIVNMGMAKMVNAPVLLAGDIDRGGVFAQLYGTVELLEPEERERIEGLIINKFRGDKSILDPGIEMLYEKCRIPITGVIPYVRVDVDDEDSLAPRLEKKSHHKRLDVAVIRLPRLSNFTDFTPLEAHPAIGVRYVRRTEELKSPDLIILPGTKNTMDDLVWLKESGLEALIRKQHAQGIPVLGVCGGYQMLGRYLENPEHTEGDLESLNGLGLLPVRTVFSVEKTRNHKKAEVTAELFAGAKLEGYEIHMGETTAVRDESAGEKASDCVETFCRMEDGRADGWLRKPDSEGGLVIGTYLHGLFDTGELTLRLAEYLAERKGISISDVQPVPHEVYVQQQYDILADAVRSSMDIEELYRIMDKYASD